VLLAIREAVIYIFEIPSGVIADKYGKKTELIICFLFYIASFVFFFIGGSFIVFTIAFVLYGFGEAFRSGTHKSIIMDFMEHHNLHTKKSQIYGLTRSYSMLGSALSSLMGIIFILVLPDLAILFILAIVPYILDLLLILSYPGYLNQKQESTISIKDFFKGIVLVIMYFFRERSVRLILLDSSTYNAIFKSVKDFVQPILVSLMAGIIIIDFLNVEDNTEVMIGLTYMVAFIISSFASKYTHKLLQKFNHSNIIHAIWLFTAIVMLVLYMYTDNIVIVIGLFLLIYFLQNIRKPLVVENIGNATAQDKRASILSVESQLTSVFVIILAPALGLIYDHYGGSYVFLSLGILNIFLFILTMKQQYK
jgi:MFS family permease